jgi:hypothetical protein
MIGKCSRSCGLLGFPNWLERELNRKRGDETRLSARAVDVLDRRGAGSFEPESWSTLLTTRRVAVIGVSRF